MNCEHEGHGADVGQAVPDDQPGHLACLLLLDHLDHPDVDRDGGQEHGDVDEEVDLRDLVHSLR